MTTSHMWLVAVVLDIKAMRSENLIEYSIKMRVESIISVTEKSDYYAIISVISCFTAIFPFRKFEFRGTKDSKIIVFFAFGSDINTPF